MALSDADSQKYHKVGYQILIKVHGKYFDGTKKCPMIHPVPILQLNKKIVHLLPHQRYVEYQSD